MKIAAIPRASTRLAIGIQMLLRLRVGENVNRWIRLVKRPAFVHYAALLKVADRLGVGRSLNLSPSLGRDEAS
jgi:hypothetical protein